MNEEFKRKVIVYGSDFWDFYNDQKKKVQEKIDWIISLVQTLKILPKKFFKHIEGEDSLFEIRIKVETNIFRIFCFFDEGNLVILLNAFQKKTQKTPMNEIQKALKLKNGYYEERKAK